MIIDWVAVKMQHFLPVQNAGLDELSVSFDFALSPEMMDLLHALNDDLYAGGRVTQGAVAEAGQQDQAANMITIMQLALDEHELALT